MTQPGEILLAPASVTTLWSNKCLCEANAAIFFVGSVYRLIVAGCTHRNGRIVEVMM